MAAVANNPAFAKKAGIPQSVGSEFIKADKGKKFAKGGDMKKLPPFMGKETKAEEAKEMKIKAKSKALYDLGEKAEGVHGKSGKEKPTKYAKGGGVETHGKTQGTIIKMAVGGSVDSKSKTATPAPKPMPKPMPKPTPDSEIPSEAREVMRQRDKDRAFEAGEKYRKENMGKAFAKGGCVKMARGGGCETRGKTRGKFV